MVQPEQPARAADPPPYWPTQAQTDEAETGARLPLNAETPSPPEPDPPTPLEEASVQAQILAAEAAYRMQQLFDGLIAQGLEARPGAAVALSVLIAAMTPLPPAPGLTGMANRVTEARKI